MMSHYDFRRWSEQTRPANAEARHAMNDDFRNGAVTAAADWWQRCGSGAENVVEADGVSISVVREVESFFV